MIPDRFDAPFKISWCLGGLELRGWGPIDPRQMISQFHVLFSFIAIHWVIQAISCFCICFEATSIGNKCVYHMELLVQCLSKNGLVYTFRILVDTMIHRSESKKKDWMTGSLHLDTISEEILDRYSYTPVREFQATGCEDWCKENSRRHVSNILSNEPYFVSKGLVVPHVISVHYSHDMPLVLWYTLYSPYYHRVSHWFC